MAAPLQAYSANESLEKCLQQPGSYFVAIEAGADTKPLVDLQKKAIAEGYTILKAPASKTDNYIFERIWPDELKHYAKDIPIASPAKLQRAFVIAPSGLLADKVETSESPLDDDIYASMLTAVRNFCQDSISRGSTKEEGEPYQVLHLGNFTCELVYNQNFSTAVIYDGDLDSRIKADLKKTHEQIDEQFGDKLKTWDGDPLGGNLKSILKQNLIDTNKYNGKYDLDTLKYLHGQRKENTLRALESIAKDKKVLVYVDNLENLDSNTAAALEHIARNAKAGNFAFVGAYGVDSLKADPEDISKVRKNLEEANYIELKSQGNIEEILNESFKGLNPSAARMLAISAIAGDAADKMIIPEAAKLSGIEEYDRVEAASQLGAAGLLDRFKPANIRIAKKAKENADPALYKTVAEVIEKFHKTDVQRFSPILADLYLNANEKESAVKWAKVAAEMSLQNFNTDNAIHFYKILVANSDSDRLESLEKMVEVGWLGGKDFQEVFTNAEELEKLALESENYEKAFFAILHKARVFNSVGKIGEAIREATRAGELLQKLGREDFDLELFNGINLFCEKKYDQALEHYEKAQRIAEATGNYKRQFKAYTNVGNVFRKTKQTEKSIEAYKKALFATEQINDIFAQAIVLDNLAALFADMNRCKECDEYVEKLLELYKSNNIVTLLPSTYTTASYNANKKGDFKKAIEFGEKAQASAQRLGHKGFDRSIRENMAEAHARILAQLMPEEREISEKALEIAKKLADMS